ncbi:hypothetical protein SERLA73DRAFT_112084 [Serpula lacrymans var. lacrymans S7.3]|uniref:HCP-like protein n=2 Tax=Serpula lacrymans var. lacrymans TaxID=341189 RepID=F8Q5Z0_SERL3|nr:uncharacterized protein SERLADRAFT_451578 [Serpula lacrymans var. lacrymans S7.9]EGN96028.1 hypothetical protein SERLA73DRAFT_112084 [Serpula lacrymans var. lacrymans S7.3]EGO21554.1 hypothetical protein SERLADRAFT_451578 [Serpula lacrymans var. lacrymans S7.9]
MSDSPPDYFDQPSSTSYLGTDQDSFEDSVSARRHGFYSDRTDFLTYHPNRSVPSLPSQRLVEYEGDIPIPAIPTMDASLVGAMNNIRLSDPVPRGASAMSFRSDPDPRVGTSAMHTTSPTQRMPSETGYMNNLSPDYSLYLGPPHAADVHTDGAALPSTGLNYSHQHFRTGWQAQTMVQPAPPPMGDYNYLYAAASDVLGVGPPLGASSLPYNPTSFQASHNPPTASQLSLPSSQSSQYFGQQGNNPYHGGATLSQYTNEPSSAQLAMQGLDDPEFELRPSLQRSGTTASVNLRTRKTKAVDLSAPPFTKEYIDQYRQRIKADPDPEAHFLYAKYLIEAAKKIGSDAKDQRTVKKYRDFLIQESLKVIRRLATQAEAYDEAQFFLANCYGTGMLGLQVDHERAYHLYLQAAKQNHAAASYRVAVCNEIGAGTRREPPRAAAFYRKAASLGDTAAMYKLGMILLLGSLGEQKNPRDAINWLKRAAEQADEENPHALHELGLLHEAPNSQLVVYDPAYAKALFTQAAHLGYSQSQYKLGQCFEYGALTCPVDPRRSIAWYTKAAEKGNSEAELALSGWYLTGSEGVLKQSDSEAYLWARRAANKGLNKAEYAVGYYAEVGIGIKQDVEFAKRWYMRAAAQGNKRAMNRLTEMKRMGNKRSMARPTRQQAKDECTIC